MKTLWRCNNTECNFEYLGEDFVDPPDTDCPKCEYHDSVVIVEEFEDNTLQEFLERSDNTVNTKCQHPRDKRTYVGRNNLKCGVCGEVFE